MGGGGGSDNSKYVDIVNLDKITSEETKRLMESVDMWRVYSGAVNVDAKRLLGVLDSLTKAADKIVAEVEFDSSELDLAKFRTLITEFNNAVSADEEICEECGLRDSDTRYGLSEYVDSFTGESLYNYLHEAGVWV